MSEVTNLIISFSIIEDEISRASDLNLFFNNGKGFKAVSADFQGDQNTDNIQRWYGGDKHLETPLYIGAYNNLELAELIKHIKNISWEEPQNVQLIIKAQNSNKFEIVGIQ